jgi:hypothetical protein
MFCFCGAARCEKLANSQCFREIHDTVVELVGFGEAAIWLGESVTENRGFEMEVFARCLKVSSAAVSAEGYVK